MDNNLDNNQGGRRPDKGDPRRDQDPNRNKKNHQSILAFLICLLVTLVCFSDRCGGTHGFRAYARHPHVCAF